MSYFIRNGNTYKVADSAAIDLHNHLPAGNYIIQSHPFEGLYLEQIDSFKPQGKVYGDTLKNADRIINTFLDRTGKSTGVMLTGEKGSGKTLLARTLSIKCAEQNIPTIVINSAWSGDQFNKLIQDIDQPCMVLFDEFEKVYDEDEQESILTLMDGVYPMQKLFVLTCNDKWRVDRHMRNRPGRIYYMLDFRGLEESFIREYCYDNLKDASLKNIDSICTVASLFNEFNFDMLKALVEEINRYGDTPQEAVKLLNVKAEFDSGTFYDIRVVVNGQTMKVHHPNEYHGNPMNMERERFHWISPSPKPASVKEQSVLGRETCSGDWDDDDEERNNSQFSAQDLVKVLPAQGVFEFRNRHGHQLTLTKQRYSSYNFNAF
jgi:hypothetical protein